MTVDWASFKRKLAVPIDEDSPYENTVWCNNGRDGLTSRIGYWTVSGSCISAWTIGSTLLAFGLSPQQAIGCVAVGGVFTGILAVACGWMGERHHIGFPVASRFSWGMRGSYFPVIIRCFLGCIWFGMQSYWGGQATRVLIGAIIPGFAHMKNTFPESSHLQTNDFIGMVLWYLIFLPLLLISPERLQIPFGISFILFSSTCIGILSWAVKSAGGPGSMFHQPATTGSVGWGVMFGITAILGAWGSATLSQSDWTRYANRPLAPTLSQLFAVPITITITAMIGIIVTSAANDILGEIIWSPIELLAAIQEHYGSSPRSRAGVFFASIGTISTQLAISLVLNSVSAGMDLAGLQPKYINIRRGSYVMAAIGLVSQPWQLLANADKFLTVLSGFGIFVAPLTGIQLSDYLVVRRQRLKLNDLYKGDSSSIYWYWHGFNWRGFVAFTISIWSQIPGLVASVNKSQSPAMQGWIRLFNITFFVGLAMGFTWMTVLSYLFPPPGLGVEAPFVEDYHSTQELKAPQEIEDVSRGSSQAAPTPETC
ncbi:uracil permease [Nannizzia gypsea CBS 118893]|uniref:Uracil permease n=1 Tax=Arthroderma gypseum (strain ATCC MYA-4604 / CBS 118893) TaxID=535722 RepID=E4UZ51_ARTGP|nr:uracil permease [Nannizzia gypsea CBS 118893]EFR03381.1 uracil permease [Nannizzia gypsea CBS 118893]